MPYLMYTKPGQEPLWFELQEGQLIGEGEDCQLCLGPASPSRYVARVRLEGDHVWLEVLLPGSLRMGGLQEELLDLEEGAQIVVEPLQSTLQFYRVRPALPPAPLHVQASGSSPSTPAAPDVRAAAVVSRTVPRALTAPSPFELRPIFPPASSMGLPASSAPPSFILGELGEVTLPIPSAYIAGDGDTPEEALLTQKTASAELTERPPLRTVDMDDAPTAISLRRTDPMPPPVPPTLFLPSAASGSRVAIRHGETEAGELTHVMEATQHSWRSLPDLVLDEEHSVSTGPMASAPHAPAPARMPASGAGPLEGQSPELAESSVAALASRPAPMQTEAPRNVPVAPDSYSALARGRSTAQGAMPNHASVRSAEAHVSAADPHAVKRLVVGAPVLAEQAQEDGGWWSWWTQFLWGLALVLVGAVILVVLEGL